MPLFCFLSGYVAKFNMRKLIGQTEVMYIKVSIFYYLFRVIVLNETLSVRRLIKNIVCPWWHLWYLDALVFWGLCLFIVDKIRNRFIMICVALIFSLAAGYLEIPLLRSRVIVFFPFYLVGYLYKKEIKAFLEKCKYKKWSVFGWITLGASGMLICLYNDKINSESFFNWQSYQSGGYTIQNRIVYIVCAFVIVWSVLLVIKNIEFNFFIELGKRTLPIYIFHAIVFWFLDSLGINEILINCGKISWILLYIIVCVGGCIIFLPLFKNKAIIHNWC